MKKLACLAVVSALGMAAGASAAGSSLAPHIYGVQIRGATPPALNATWLFAIKQTQFEIARNRAVVVKGTVAISGNRVTFHDISGAFACRGAQATGAYTWRVSGTTLTLHRIHDTCVGRSRVLAGVFKRVQ